MTKKIRVLQVVYEMGVGGIETWLMNILRNIDREQFDIDFLVYTSEPRFHDKEIRASGSRIISCTHPSRWLKHEAHLRSILSQEGPYDVIHAHGSYSVGRTLRIARIVGIPVRIAHAHNDFRRIKRGWRSRLLKPLAKYWMDKYMTVGIGVSKDASSSLFGPNYEKDSRCKVLYYGIDWARFADRFKPNEIRQQNSLPLESLIVGHVGRFVPQKNHSFFVEVAKSMIGRIDNVHFLLVGDGFLKNNIEEMVKSSGIENHFTFIGERSDIPQLLQAMDVFLFPSLYEGLGIALLEAQAVGLPCVVSNTIPGEVKVVENQVIQLSLNAPIDKWASAVFDMARQDREDNHLTAWNAVAGSQFSLKHNIEILSNIYRGRAPDY